jgi:hypothetical protein
MQRLRSLQTKARYTQIPNDAIDRLPDLNSVGLLATYLRHHDNFEFDLKKYLRGKPGVGEAAGYKARTTLIRAGYLVQVKVQHSHRGWFHTDIWRTSEPFTEEDLAEIARRYVIGSCVELPIDTGKTREYVPTSVTVLWVEMTSFRGVEVSDSDDAEPQTSPPTTPVDNSATGTQHTVKDQVTPDRGFSGPGRPDPGAPVPGFPVPGAPGSYKKKKENTKNKPSPGRQATRARAGRVPACLPGADDFPSVRTGRPKTPPGATPPSSGEELLSRLPARLATPQVRRQHARRVDALLDAGWDPEDLRLRWMVECDGNVGPGRLVKALRDTPAAPSVYQDAYSLESSAAVTTHASGRASAPVPWCGECESPTCRRVSVEVEVEVYRGRPQGALTEQIAPCPKCGPK